MTWWIRLKGRQEEYQTGFSWVVANPPYGAKLTDTYKKALQGWMPEVFYGQPDTYVFFFMLALRFLGEGGRLGLHHPQTLTSWERIVPPSVSSFWRLGASPRSSIYPRESGRT